MKRYLIFTLGLLFFIGCSHGEKISSVQAEMSVDELRAKMGSPEGYTKSGKIEVYSYYNELISDLGKNRADYHYIYIDGKLVEYGAGELKQNQETGMFHIEPHQ
jgi:hypothetical protein